jgi:hypothetical protein
MLEVTARQAEVIAVALRYLGFMVLSQVLARECVDASVLVDLQRNREQLRPGYTCERCAALNKFGVLSMRCPLHSEAGQ